MINIELARIEEFNAMELDRVYNLLIHAYAVTEREIWGENYSRLSLDEFKSLIISGEVYVAREASEIVGSITVSRLDSESFGFGLLNADFSKSGKGIGRKLIEVAEQHALRHEAKYMKIEILRPSNEEIPQKMKLANWYSAMGYEFIESMSFEERKPDKAEKALKLISPTQFDCYTKTLIN